MNKRTLVKFYTNILEESFNYIKQNYDDYNIPLLLELDITDGCSNYNSIVNDNKKYEVINEIDLLNISIATLKNIVDLNKLKYVGAIVVNNSDGVSRGLQLIQIDNLEQLEYLKQYVDCDPYSYKSILK